MSDNDVSPYIRKVLESPQTEAEMRAKRSARAKAKKSVDPICLELAGHFLPADARDNSKHDLAQAIQDAVEVWLDGEARENPASEIAHQEGCTCRWVGEGNDPDGHIRTDEWCPLHGRDPDAERDALMDSEG